MSERGLSAIEQLMTLLSCVEFVLSFANHCYRTLSIRIKALSAPTGGSGTVGLEGAQLMFARLLLTC